MSVLSAMGRGQFKVPKNKTYLGDSVYAEFDGYSIILTTENGYPDDPRNRIMLEPQVYADLIRWVVHITERK